MQLFFRQAMNYRDGQKLSVIGVPIIERKQGYKVHILFKKEKKL